MENLYAKGQDASFQPGMSCSGPSLHVVDMQTNHCSIYSSEEWKVTMVLCKQANIPLVVVVCTGE